jgi:hypothetical protein
MRTLLIGTRKISEYLIGKGIPLGPRQVEHKAKKAQIPAFKDGDTWNSFSDTLDAHFAAKDDEAKRRVAGVDQHSGAAA